MTTGRINQVSTVVYIQCVCVCVYRRALCVCVCAARAQPTQPHSARPPTTNRVSIFSLSSLSLLLASGRASERASVIVCVCYIQRTHIWCVCARFHA